MSYRYNLTNAQWQRIADFFPDRYHHGHRGHPWKEHRRLVNGILWHLHSGAPWPDTPKRYGPWQTVYDRFNRWRKDGTWAKILDALLRHLDEGGVIERDLWCFDGTINRAHTAAAGAKKKSGAAAAVGRSQDSANARATGSCAGAFAGWLRHQDAPGL